MHALRQYCTNILIALDQLSNTVLGGDPDETISSRVGKFAERGEGWIPCQLCKLLNYFDEDHCIKAIERREGKNTVWFKQK